MESQPQNPEFRNNPENFHPYSILKFTPDILSKQLQSNSDSWKFARKGYILIAC